MTEAEEQEQEYCQRELYFYTQFKGRWCNHPTYRNFHPWLWIGTEKDYNELCEFYNNNANGKIIGSFSYKTFEEYQLSHPNKNIK